MSHTLLPFTTKTTPCCLLASWTKARTRCGTCHTCLVLHVTHSFEGCVCSCTRPPSLNWAASVPTVVWPCARVYYSTGMVCQDTKIRRWNVWSRKRKALMVWGHTRHPESASTDLSMIKWLWFRRICLWRQKCQCSRCASGRASLWSLSPERITGPTCAPIESVLDTLLHLCIYVHVCVSIHTSRHASMHASIHTHTFTSMPAHAHTCTYVHSEPCKCCMQRLTCTPHSGFSTGFNVSESVNFANEGWIPYGIKSLQGYRSSHRESVIGTPLPCTPIHSFFFWGVWYTPALHAYTFIFLLGCLHTHAHARAQLEKRAALLCVASWRSDRLHVHVSLVYRHMYAAMCACTCTLAHARTHTHTHARARTFKDRYMIQRWKGC